MYPESAAVTGLSAVERNPDIRGRHLVDEERGHRPINSSRYAADSTGMFVNTVSA
jgi:hypothetical protein